MHIKSHKRKVKNGVSVVKNHSRKDRDRVSKLRGHKVFSENQRDNLAERGYALPDGSYPIKSKRDLANAISAYGRSKNPEIVKQHIKKRARVLGETSLLPDNW